MQRLHQDDLAGKLLREGNWHHLDLPAIAVEDQEIAIGPGKVYHRRAGAALHPERESLATLELIKNEMGSLAFASQYLQRPVPLEGNLIRHKWIGWFDGVPDPIPGAEIVQSWDIASTTAGDFSVCTTWMKRSRKYYLINVWRGRLEFPDLRRKVIALAQDFRANRILIEQAGPGLHMIQELRANPVAGVRTPIGIHRWVTRSREWRHSQRVLKRDRFFCPGRRHGSVISCTSFWRFRIHVTTTKPTACRSFSIGLKSGASITEVLSPAPSSFVDEYAIVSALRGLLDHMTIVMIANRRDLGTRTEFKKTRYLPRRSASGPRAETQLSLIRCSTPQASQLVGSRTVRVMGIMLSAHNRKLRRSIVS